MFRIESRSRWDEIRDEFPALRNLQIVKPVPELAIDGIRVYVHRSVDDAPEVLSLTGDTTESQAPIAGAYVWRNVELATTKGSCQMVRPDTVATWLDDYVHDGPFVVVLEEVHERSTPYSTFSVHIVKNHSAREWWQRRSRNLCDLIEAICKAPDEEERPVHANK